MKLIHNETYRKKNNGWQVIVSYKDTNNKWRQKSKQGFKKKEDAKTEADQIIKELKNTVELNTPIDFKDITFKEYSDMHMKHLKVLHEAATICGYQTILLKFKDLDDMKLTDIKPFHIQKIVDGMVSTNKNGTISTYLQRLHSFFQPALDLYSILYKNPVKNIKYKSNVESDPRRALTDKEAYELLDNLKKGFYNHYLISLIALDCGLRIGEIIGLTLSDIDLDKKTIRINKQWKLLDDDTNTYGFGQTKTLNSNRNVPMTKRVYDELCSIKVININGRLFNYKNTSAIAADLRKKYKKLGFKITVHELRHTYATNLIRTKNFDYKTVAKFMGHDVEQTIKTYSHVTTDMLEEAFNLINNS